MADDTVTLALHGDVPLAKFAEAVSGFSRLLDALSEEANAKAIRWVVTNLEVSSALATARGLSVNGLGEVERVAGLYLSVGRTLERGEPLAFSPRVEREARSITAVLDGDVKAVRFETAEADARVLKQIPTVPVEPPAAAYGAVEGRVQTLTSRGGLRFTLYDTLHDRAVSCYLAENHEEIMRDVWGRLAIVAGRVSRDPESGRPLAVRQITRVERLPETEPLSYRRLRGIAPRGELTAEDAIRRLRDAG